MLAIYSVKAKKLYRNFRYSFAVTTYQLGFDIIIILSFFGLIEERNDGL